MSYCGVTTGRSGSSLVTKHVNKHYIIQHLEHCTVWHYVRNIYSEGPEDPGHREELLCDEDGEVDVPGVYGGGGPDGPRDVSLAAVAAHGGSSCPRVREGRTRTARAPPILVLALRAPCLRYAPIPRSVSSS